MSAQAELGFGGFRISITAPVAGSIFLTGEAAPVDPTKRLSTACSYSTAACRLKARIFATGDFALRRVLLKRLVGRVMPSQLATSF
jgi:hypothetical protein